eukprot:3441346-Pleurochrysis_carterae.AAC.1
MCKAEGATVHSGHSFLIKGALYALSAHERCKTRVPTLRAKRQAECGLRVSDVDDEFCSHLDAILLLIVLVHHL